MACICGQTADKIITKHTFEYPVALKLQNVSSQNQNASVAMVFRM